MLASTGILYFSLDPFYSLEHFQRLLEIRAKSQALNGLTAHNISECSLSYVYTCHHTLYSIRVTPAWELVNRYVNNLPGGIFKI